jgi:hypothetical protein
VREMLPGVVRDVLKPLKLQAHSLFLADSLHGDGPTLDKIEALKLQYIVGANKLTATGKTLQEQPELFWQNTGGNVRRGWSESGLCVCYLQCESWEKKRLLVGRRWKREGEFIWNDSGIMTSLTEGDVAHVQAERSLSYTETIWHLYDQKMGMETYYKDLLTDLGLHHPSCLEIVRNAGFYAVVTLAHTLMRGVDLIGSQNSLRGSSVRQDNSPRKRPRPRRMRLWRLRRRFFALPGRIACHAGVMKVTLLGLSATLRREFESLFQSICRC